MKNPIGSLRQLLIVCDYDQARLLLSYPVDKQPEDNGCRMTIKIPRWFIGQQT